MRTLITQTGCFRYITFRLIKHTKIQKSPNFILENSVLQITIRCMEMSGNYTSMLDNNIHIHSMLSHCLQLFLSCEKFNITNTQQSLKHGHDKYFL